MKYLLMSIFIGLLISPASAAAEEVLREVSWSELGSELPRGVELNGDGSVTIAHGADGPVTTKLLEIDGPGITAHRYAFTGRVKHADVRGEAYLEMWSYFRGGAHYFSRTLAQQGPMKHLGGTSDWRPVVVPFFMDDGSPPPNKLVLNVVLVDGGTVQLSPLKLVQYGVDEDPLAAPMDVAGQWWSNQMGGVIGGGLGALLGLIGAAIGILAALGKGRSVVMTGIKALIALCAMSGVAGVVALLLGQPYAVYYPLLLIGLIGTVVPAGVYPALKRRYEEVELRAMRAMDAT